MPQKLLGFGLVAAISLLPAEGRELNHSWEKLAQTVKPGAKVEVTKMNGQISTGELVSIASDSITVKAESAIRYTTINWTVLSKDVLRVRMPGSKGRHMLIGAAIVAVPMALLCAVGAGSTGDGPNGGGSAAATGGTAGAIFGMGLGAGLGAVLPRPMGQPLYEATSESRAAWLKDQTAPQTRSTPVESAK